MGLLLRRESPSGNCTLRFPSENHFLSYICNENSNLHDEAAVSFCAGRSLVALRDLCHSLLLSAGRDRKRLLRRRLRVVIVLTTYL